MADALHERRRHLDEWRSEHVRQNERPGAGHSLGSTLVQVQPPVQLIDARVLGGHAQRRVIDINGQRSRYAEHQRSERQHAGPGPHVERPRRWGGAIADDVLERFEAESSGRMQSSAERSGINKSQDAWHCLVVGRRDAKAPSATSRRTSLSHAPVE